MSEFLGAQVSVVPMFKYSEGVSEGGREGVSE